MKDFKFINQFPISIQENIKLTLTCYDRCNVYYSNGKYSVGVGCGISSEYARDFKSFGEIYNTDIYTDEEIKINIKNM